MWRNWSGYVCSPDATVSTPASLAAAAVLRDAAAAGHRARGRRRSLVLAARADRRRDPVARRDAGRDRRRPRPARRARAGRHAAVATGALAAHGLAMENLGDINVQSIAGATSTGTHGTGITLGNLSTQIDSLTFMCADGSEIRASADTHPDLFAGGRIAGALGVLTEIGLRLVPAFAAPRARRDAARRLPRASGCADREASLVRVLLVPAYGHRADQGVGHDRRAGRRGALGEPCVRIVPREHGVRRAVRPARAVAVPGAEPVCASTVSAGRHVDASYAMLSTVRRVRFNEMEWSVPAERGADALREIRSFIARRSFPLMFPLEYRWVRGDDIWLAGLRPRQRAHLGAPVSRDAVRRVLLGRAGDLPQSRRAAALVHDEGRRAGGVLSALGRFPRAARTNGPAWPLPDAVPAHAVRPAATRKRSLSRVRHTGPPRDTPMHETAGIAQDRPRSNQEAS